jgi:hypothetical protein
MQLQIQTFVPSRFLLAFAIGIFAAGPSQSQSQGPKTEAAFKKYMQSLVGSKMEDLVAKWGEPLNIEEGNQPGFKRYRFQREPKEIEIADEKLILWCEITLEASADGKIKAFSYLGPTCVAADQDPNAYGGPIAQIRGVGKMENAKTILWFNFSEIYGAPRLPSQCQGEAFRRGDAVPARCVGDQIPAVAMKIKLQLYRNSVDARPDARENLLAEGVVDFSPEANGIYEIAGEVTPDYSAVWVRNLKNEQPATAKVIKKVN